MRLDRAPCKFVTERERSIGQCHHARRQTLLNCLRHIRRALGAGPDFHLVEQPTLCLTGHQRNQIGNGPRRRRQARQARDHRIAHGRRHMQRGDGERLGNIEGIAAGDLMQTSCRPASNFGQHLDGLGTQRRQRHTLQDLRWQIAKYRLQRMPWPDLVITVTEDQHDPQLSQPTAKKLDEVEGRLVGPVHVLDDEDAGHRARRKMLHGEMEDHVAPGCCEDRLQQVAAGLPGHVIERRQGIGGKERLAATPQNPCCLRLLGSKLLQQGRLADSGLTRDKHDTALTSRSRAQASVQGLKLWASLQQFHDGKTPIRDRVTGA